MIITSHFSGADDFRCDCLGVAIARDAPQGWAIAIDFKLDTTLVDIGPPGMNGYELARQWRATPEGQKLTLVAMTGYGHAEDRREARAAGFDGHPVKPAGLNELESLLAANRKTERI